MQAKTKLTAGITVLTIVAFAVSHWRTASPDTEQSLESASLAESEMEKDRP